MSAPDILGVRPEPWMAAGHCAGTFAPDEWFPVRETPEVAETMCGGCPVVAECLTFAMQDANTEGIWGATTTAMRDQLRRNPMCGTRNGYARHKRAGEDACRECKDASAQQRREQYAAKRAGDAA